MRLVCCFYLILLFWHDTAPTLGLICLLLCSGKISRFLVSTVWLDLLCATDNISSFGACIDFSVDRENWSTVPLSDSQDITPFWFWTTSACNLRLSSLIPVPYSIFPDIYDISRILSWAWSQHAASNHWSSSVMTSTIFTDKTRIYVTPPLTKIDIHRYSFQTSITEWVTLTRLKHYSLVLDHSFYKPSHLMVFLMVWHRDSLIVSH